MVGVHKTDEAANKKRRETSKPAAGKCNKYWILAERIDITYGRTACILQNVHPINIPRWVPSGPPPRLVIKDAVADMGELLDDPVVLVAGVALAQAVD